LESSVSPRSINTRTPGGVCLQRSALLGASRNYIECLRRDAAFHCFIAAYAVAGLLAAFATGVPHKFIPGAYLGLGAHLGAQALLLAAVVAMAFWSLNPPAPLQAGLRKLGLVFSPHTLAGLLLFLNMSVFMGVFSSLKTMLPEIVPFFADQILAHVDRILHGKDPWLYSTALLRADVTPMIEFLYFGVWGLLLPGTLLAVLLMPKLEAIRAQYVWTVLLVWPLLGNLMAGALMSAGPVYYELVTGEPRFAGLLNYLARHSLGQDAVQGFLWNVYLTREAVAGAGISAFPSMHLATATLFVLLAGHIHRGLMWAAVAFCAVILFGSVHLGWHYAVDGYFSIAATLVIWRAVGWTLRAVSAGKRSRNFAGSVADLPSRLRGQVSCGSGRDDGLGV
jgi:hypothetical protein